MHIILPSTLVRYSRASMAGGPEQTSQSRVTENRLESYLEKPGIRIVLPCSG